MYHSVYIKCEVPNMRYVMTLIWSVLISAAIAFVLSSMAGESFMLQEALILSVIFTILIALIGDGAIRETEN